MDCVDKHITSYSLALHVMTRFLKTLQLCLHENWLDCSQSLVMSRHGDMVLMLNNGVTHILCTLHTEGELSEA